MPKREDIHKILLIGSGPIVIGQAAEFDYAGTQSLIALKEEGYEVILCNSNPATIMTDTNLADKVYMEPLNLEYLAKILRYERPDAILSATGGQTGLNLAMDLERKGVLKECDVELLGTKIESIKRAEDRELFKELCEKLGEPVLPSDIAKNMEDGLKVAEKIGYPLVLRPAFTLGGTGGGFANNEEEFREIMKNALSLSPVNEVLIEKSIKGYKEIEIEAMRDKNDNAICICDMENIDPVGVHTGDSIVVCPSETLSDKELQMLKRSAIKIIRELKIEGGCNVQFALDPHSFTYYLIEVNPRVSRSSALASKASGYPIARVSSKIAIGMTLDEIYIKNVQGIFEPSLDYVIVKMPRFPFDKFTRANNSLGTQMKATGEIMSIGRTLEEALLKGVRSLETGVVHLYMKKFSNYSVNELLDYIKDFKDDTIFAISELIRRKTDIGLISDISKIDMLFLNKIKNIIKMEYEIKENKEGIINLINENCKGKREDYFNLNFNNLKNEIKVFFLSKKMGFSDVFISFLLSDENRKVSEEEIFNLRKKLDIFPVYKMIDSVCGTLENEKPCYYSTYELENESVSLDEDKEKKIIVLGAGPIRIGQGVEFDYSSVHAVTTIKNMGYKAIIINNNPETVSTDYTVSDKLYFEPLVIEDVMNIIEMEKPDGVIATLGGQTAINLADKLNERNVKLIGTSVEAIDRAENRDSFEKLLEKLNIPQPKGKAITNIEDGIKAAKDIGYPVLVRPSFVLGGRAMEIVANEESLKHYLKTAVEIDKDKPVLVDKYIQGKELEVDAVCDLENVFVPGIMELVERTGVHSGDSISVYPTFSVSQKVKDTILDYTKKLGLGIGIKGLYNIQFIVDKNENVYIIEVNPRSSRTVPFLSKATGYNLADIGTMVMLGRTLKEQGYTNLYPMEKHRHFVKVPAFSFSKLKGLDAYLSPEMKSTGEAIGYDKSLTRALFKALKASNMKVVNYGTVFATIADDDKQEALSLIKRFYDMGFNIEATKGTAEFLKKHNIKTKVRGKISEGSNDIIKAIQEGYVTYVINTKDVNEQSPLSDGSKIREVATQNNVTIFTNLDTVRVLLDVLEEITIGISTIDA